MNKGYLRFFHRSWSIKQDFMFYGNVSKAARTLARKKGLNLASFRSQMCPVLPIFKQNINSTAYLST
jgi:hypothetical protein